MVRLERSQVGVLDLYTAVDCSTIFHMMCKNHLSVKQYLVAPNKCTYPTRKKCNTKKFQIQKSFISEIGKSFETKSDDDEKT